MSFVLGIFTEICRGDPSVVRIGKKNERLFVWRSTYIQGVSGGIVNILGGGIMDYSE